VLLGPGIFAYAVLTPLLAGMQATGIEDLWPPPALQLPAVPK
jgi:hypothetical protein